ncbi:MAG: DUF1232 domain-containing protein [Atribacteria sp.]|nr:DUF1232 domain-containing protein [Candidatus Atribacteria bacterium]
MTIKRSGNDPSETRFHGEGPNKYYMQFNGAGIKVWRINCMSENKDPYSKLKKQLYLARIIFHIPNFIKLSLRLLKDRKVPFYLKLLVYGAIAYVLSPYDLIPDFLVPFLGFFEDIIIGILCLTGLVKLSPPEVVAGHVKAIDMENKQRYRFFR